MATEPDDREAIVRHEILPIALWAHRCADGVGACTGISESVLDTFIIDVSTRGPMTLRHILFEAFPVEPGQEPENDHDGEDD